MSENKFSVGDKVKRIGPTYYDAVEGWEYMISNINGRLIQILGSNMYYDFLHFELVEENKMQKQFTKNDLKDWMRVVTRNGNCYIVNLDKAILIRENEYYVRISEYGLNLNNTFCPGDFDIVEVYESPFSNECLNPKAKGDLLWKREEKSPEQIEAENITKEIESLKLRLEELSKKI